MRNPARTSWMTALTILIVSGQAAAQSPQGTLQLDMVVEKEIVVTNAEGELETRRVPAAKVIPDDKVIYTIQYRNEGAEEADHVNITNPVPEHMAYVDGTATGAGATITFSVDGGNIFDVPENLTVTSVDGTTRKATALDYTHIRWTLQERVAAHASGEVSFWAQLE
jgi:uncharacterized repeat protein (TIGR01451 family)